MFSRDRYTKYSIGLTNERILMLYDVLWTTKIDLKIDIYSLITIIYSCVILQASVY